MIINSLSERTECLLVRSSIIRCQPSKNTKEKWINTAKKLCQTINTNNKNKPQRRIQFKTRFRRLNRFVLTTMHCLVILNSQLMTLLCTMIQFNHQSMPWTCQWLNGKDHRKLFHQILLQLCIEIDLIQVILNKEPQEIAGSWDHFSSKAPTQNY